MNNETRKETQVLPKDVRYVGADDLTLPLFENQYPVQPMGVSYNSYLILDEKIAVMDSVDARAADEWLAKLAHELDGRSPDYLVISHMEPDHSGSILRLAEKYQEMKLVGNTKTFTMLRQFFGAKAPTDDRLLEVGEGETLPLGAHTLHFMLAPMVHWPEVMVAYEETEKLLFSADAFGRFGALSRTAAAPWAPQARRYYYNIVGKYGAQVQAVLKKAAALDIAMICPLHGPVLKEDLGHYIDKYNIWSSYGVESEGVFIAYASVYGNTRKAADMLASKLADKGVHVTVSDLARDDWAECLEDAFRYGKLVLAAPTYNADVFPAMKEFINHLTERNYQNRTIGIIENGSWAPMAAKVMKGMFEKSKNITFAENTVTVRSAVNAANEAQIEALAEELKG